MKTVTDTSCSGTSKPKKIKQQKSITGAQSTVRHESVKEDEGDQDSGDDKNTKEPETTSREDDDISTVQDFVDKTGTKIDTGKPSKKPWSFSQDGKDHTTFHVEISNDKGKIDFDRWTSDDTDNPDKIKILRDLIHEIDAFGDVKDLADFRKAFNLTDTKETIAEQIFDGYKKASEMLHKMYTDDQISRFLEIEDR